MKNFAAKIILAVDSYPNIKSWNPLQIRLGRSLPNNEIYAIVNCDVNFATCCFFTRPPGCWLSYIYILTLLIHKFLPHSVTQTSESLLVKYGQAKLYLKLTQF